MRIGCIYTVAKSVSSRASDESAGKPLTDGTEIAFGIATIASRLQHEKHQVDMLVFTHAEDYRPVLAEYIETQRPKLFCLTAVTTQFPFVKAIAAAIKETDPGVFVIIGGHHVSLNPEEATGVSGFDAICVGEGDIAVTKLAARIERGAPPTGIDNLWIKDPRTGEMERNPTGAFLQDMDSIPFIDRTLWEPWIAYPSADTSVLIGRGCPYRCTYCSNHAFQKLSEGKFVRTRSPENVVAEIEAITRAYPDLGAIYLEVETIGANMKYADTLFEALAEFNAGRRDKIVFGANFSVTSRFAGDAALRKKFFDGLRKANFKYLKIGLESGSERIRNEVLRRPRYSNEDFVTFCQAAKEYGIEIHTYVLVGLPTETAEDFQETVEVTRACQPEVIYLCIFYPYVGTDLYDIALSRGLIPEGHAGSTEAARERTTAYLDLPGFSKRRIVREYVLFWYKVYKGNWDFLSIAVHTVRHYILLHPRIDYLYRLLIRDNPLMSPFTAFLKRRLG